MATSAVRTSSMVGALKGGNLRLRFLNDLHVPLTDVRCGIGNDDADSLKLGQRERLQRSQDAAFVDRFHLLNDSLLWAELVD